MEIVGPIFIAVLGWEIFIRVRDRKLMGTYNPKDRSWMNGFTFGLLCGLTMFICGLTLVSFIS